MIAAALNTLWDLVGKGISPRPATIPMLYPAGHPLAGKEAGAYVFTGNGYAYQPNPAMARVAKNADSVQDVTLVDVESTRRFMLLGVPAKSLVPAFVKFHRLEDGAALSWFLDNAVPEAGRAALGLAAHPQTMAWAAFARSRSLSHAELANFLLDHREELDNPAMANQLAVLKHARTVNYEGDLDTGAAQGVRVTFDAKAGGDAKVAIPREFTAHVIPWAGLWPSSEKPKKITVLVRMRLVPPGSSDEAPKFSMVWANEAEFLAEAGEVLVEELDAKLGQFMTIMRGTNSVQRFNTAG